MILATASAIQISTLAVAGVAAVAAIAAALIVRHSERKVWQRDLRLRIYSDCIANADRIQKGLLDYAAECENKDREAILSSKFATDVRKECGELSRTLLTNLADVQTFGAKSVKAAASTLGVAVSLATSTFSWTNAIDEAKPRTDAVVSALFEFRKTVRKSMKISEK
jgi:hypothetical protein